MNIERIRENLAKWVVILVGLLLSLFVGQQIANGMFGTIALIFLALGIGALALAMPHRLWMAVPVAWPLGGQIPALNIPATVRDLFVVAVFLVFLLLIAFKIIRRKPEMSVLDLLIWMMIFYLVVAFIRNPVGLAAIESDRVGGRPYFNVMIGFLAYWILSRGTINFRSSKAFSLAVIQTRALEGAVAQLLAWMPAMAWFLSTYYTSSTFSWAFDENALPSEPGSETTERLGYLSNLGVPLATYLVTVYRPLSCLNPLNYGRFAVLALSVYCILASGFRSSLVMIGGYAAISTLMHRGRGDIWRVLSVGLVSIVILAVGQGAIFTLPLSAQRALSFLPGNWDSFALEEARDSTKWRVEMWEQMLGSNKYIDSHMFGDGFGFKRVDLERVMARRNAGLSAEQEDFMVSGGVHSGPVSAIRYVGYVGLALHLYLLGAIAWLAWKLARRAFGTALQPLVFLFCIPAIVEPFFFVFIFGAFELSVPETFFVAGMLKLLENSMNDESQVTASAQLSLPPLDPLEVNTPQTRQVAEI